MAALAMVIGAGSSAQAGTGGVRVVYCEATFLAHHRIVATETFTGADPTEFPVAKRTVAFQQIKFWSRTPDPGWAVGGFVPGRLYRTQATGNVAITFRGDGAVRALGFLLNPFGYPNQFELRVTEAGGAVTVVTLPPDITGDIYLGLSSPRGIVRIVVAQRPDLADGVSTNFSLDDVSRTAIGG